MPSFGYSLSSEILSPKQLVENAKLAEKYDFDFLMISDHFHPWSRDQGQSAFIWNTLGAISQVTSKIKVGTGVTAPIIRYHPAIVAQAAATSAVFLEGRFIFGIGTGENLNEHVVGMGWPPYEIRKQMFIEAIEIIRLLWEGGPQSYYGEYYTVDSAQIFTLPEELPPIIISAYGPKSTSVAADLGDGFVTTSANRELISQFEKESGGGKPKYAQLTVCYDKDEEKAKQTAHKLWRFTVLEGPQAAELKTPGFFDEATKSATPDQVGEKIICGSDVQKYQEKIQEYIDAGIDHIYLNQIGYNQEEFMKFYREQLIPKFG